MISILLHQNELTSYQFLKFEPSHFVFKKIDFAKAKIQVNASKQQTTIFKGQDNYFFFQKTHI
jgi:hypothetical protein